MTEETPSPSSQAEEEIDFKDKYLRLLAEMENSRKRMHKDNQEMLRFGIENVLAEVLTPMDNLENALGFAAKMSGEVGTWAQGFQMILTQFKDVLNRHGVTAFEAEGKKFDPHLHEAVETEETDKVTDGTILQVFVRGYRCGERIIRPARVKVAKELKKENTDE